MAGWTLLALAAGMATGMFFARLPALLGPAPLQVVPASGPAAAAEWARWQQAQRQGEWHSTKLWERLLQAVPLRLHAALRGLEAGHVPPKCIGRAIREPEPGHLAFEVRELRATWLDALGVWRRSDGRPCLSPEGEPQTEPLADRDADEDTTTAPGSTAGEGSEKSVDAPPLGLNVIALYQALDAALQLLRSDRSATSWELVVRAHVALAVGVPGHVFAGEICAVVSRAGDEIPAMQAPLGRLLWRWVGLARGELRRDLSEMAALATTSPPGSSRPGPPQPVSPQPASSQPEASGPASHRASQRDFLDCSTLSNAAAAGAAHASARLLSVSASAAATSQFQIVDPVGDRMTPSDVGGDGVGHGADGWVGGLVGGWADGGVDGGVDGRPAGGSSPEDLLTRGLRRLAEAAIASTHQWVRGLAGLLGAAGVLSAHAAAELTSDLTVQSFQASLRAGPIFGTRVALTHVPDEGLRVRLARFALAMHQRAAANATGVDNGNFFNAQMRNQDILDRNPDIRQLKAIARAACTDHLLANPRLSAGVRKAAFTASKHSAHHPDLLPNEEPTHSVLAALGGARLSVWATVLPPAGSHPRHNHEGNLCSGVFYAAVPVGAQPLVFDDPRGTPWRHLDALPAEAIQASAADPPGAGAGGSREGGAGRGAQGGTAEDGSRDAGIRDGAHASTGASAVRAEAIRSGSSDPRAHATLGVAGTDGGSGPTRAGGREPTAPSRYTRERLESIGHWLPGERPHAPFVTQHAFLPREGDLIVFPPWLSHSVQASNRVALRDDGEEVGKADCAGPARGFGGVPEDGPSSAAEERRRCRGQTGKCDARRRGRASFVRPQGTRISYAFNLESPSAMAAWALTV